MVDSDQVPPRSTKQSARNREVLGLLASGFVVLASPPLAAFIAFQSLAPYVPTEGSDATGSSLKARHLAEGISAIMNGAALGALLSCLALLPAGYFAYRLTKKNR
jgi:hypothetical protein